ncbi:LEA type 2 family protein [Desulfatibacillum aliphaticivorans]|uniref:LEA type 2 family protein n=1 Tax=Desulfatibacillum aliphaticivorans TaxID=218208 RepID=UPI000404C68D|nr:LEA type 2 family protein [Desulfatibacillum aliphaticivorans]
MRNIALLVTVCLFILALSSCASFGVGYKAPEVTLASIAVQDATLFETSFKVKLRVINKNADPLQIAGSEGDIYLSGSKLISIVSGQQAEVPGFGSQIIEAEAHASNLNLVPLLAKLLVQLQSGQAVEDVDYKASGVVHLVGGGLFSGRVPFKTTGVLPLSAVQNLHQGLVEPGKYVAPLTPLTAQ